MNFIKLGNNYDCINYINLFGVISDTHCIMLQRDLLDEIEFHMWFPVLNTFMLIGIALLVGIIAIVKVSKLDILWEKFRNIKLR